MLSSGLQIGDFCKRVEIAWIGSVTDTAKKKKKMLIQNLIIRGASPGFVEPISEA